MQKASDPLLDLIGGTVEPMGYELVGVEFTGRADSGRVLRVYIDHADGITVDDCAAVSHQLSGMLDVEDPIAENYVLEVSSPGLDRPLFRPDDYERFAGRGVKIRLARAMEGRRNFKGTLGGYAEGAVRVVLEDGEVTLSFEDIESARLVPEF